MHLPRVMQITFRAKHEYFWLPIAAVFVGLLAGLTDAKAALLMIGVCGLVLVNFLSPVQLFLLWLLAAPFTKSLVLDLGGNIPDISFERILFFLLMIRLGLRVVRAKSLAFKLEIEDGMLILFLGWAVFSILFWKRIALVGQATALFQQFVLPIGFYWITQQTITNESQLKKVCLAATILSILFCAPAPVEALTGITPLGQAAQRVDGVLRVRSFAGSPWEFGAVAAMLLLYNMQHLSYTGDRKLKIASRLGIALSALGVVLCFMRGAWLAAFTSVFLFLVLSKDLRKYVYLSIPVIAVAAMIWGPTLLKSSSWSERLTRTDTITGRVIISNLQIDAILREPVLGNGILPSFTVYRYGAVSEWGNYTTSLISHNTLLSMLVDFGIFALLYFGATGIILLKAVIHYRKFPEGVFLGQGLILSLGGAALVFLINALTFENRLFIYVNSLFWVTLGLIRVAIRLKAQRVDAAAPSHSDSKGKIEAVC